VITTQPAAGPAVERDALLDRAHQLAEALRPRAFEPEQLRRVPEASVHDILASQLIRIGVPTRFGGYDVDFSLMHDVAIELGRVCGASAWCYSLWGVHSWWVGYYPPAAQEEFYADGPDVLASSAGFSLHSQAEPVPGGYRLSGHWQFSSGCDYAAWLFATTNTAAGPMGTLIPRADFTILQDTWFVSGLQGTGSKDVVVDDVFVPAHRTLPGRGNMFSTTAWLPRDYHDQPRYSVPMGALLVWDLVAPAIGLAQGAIDETVTRLTGSSGRARSAESPLVQAKISESAAEVDAARALLHTDMADAQAKGAHGEAISTLDMARYARDKAYAMKLAVSAVNRLFDMAGGHALYTNDPMQRIHRDVQACMHRDGLVFDFGAQPYARALLGLDPSAVVLRAR
jgi:3-hydroxy-9,10-secoandrosta-1,3,5(10)-triene-9,17-dione monooxygenase